MATGVCRMPAIYFEPLSTRKGKEVRRPGGKVLAGRIPMRLLRIPGWSPARLAERRYSAVSPNPPPRNTRLILSDTTEPSALSSVGFPAGPKSELHASWHHAHTFPCMSNSPRSFGFRLPTGQFLPAEFFEYQPYFPNNSSESP